MHRITDAFARQGPLQLIGATLDRVAPGEVDIGLAYRPEVTQHNGFFHGGIVAMLLDVACGFAALTLMPDQQEVLSAEFKLNFLAPAQGARLVAKGRVIKSGRLLSVCVGDAFCEAEAGERHVALMQATMAGVQRRA